MLAQAPSSERETSWPLLYAAVQAWARAWAQSGRDAVRFVGAMLIYHVI